MTLFKTILRALASAGAVAVTLAAQALLGVFEGTPPTDISTPVWAVVSMIGVFLVNLLISKLPIPPKE